MIEYKDFAPRYGVIAVELWKQIEAGVYPYNDCLPSADDIAEAYETTVGTVYRAFVELERRGIARRIQGYGTVVTWRPT